MPFASLRTRTLAAALCAAALLPILNEPGAAASPPTVKIAFQGALTGPVAFYGIPIGNAVRLAVEQARDEMKKVGVDLQYLPADDQVDPAQSAAVARKVIDDGRVVAVVGPMFGVDTIAAAPLFTEAKLPMISMGTAAELATRNWTFFRAVPNDELQGKAVGAYLTKVLGLKRIAVIEDGTSYGHGLAAAVKASVLANGGDVVVSEAIDPNTDDFSSTVAKIVANQAEGVFLGASVNPETTFNRQLGEGGYKGAFFAPDGSLSPDFIRLAGSASDGTYFTCQCAPVPEYGGPTSGSLADFVTAYRARYGGSPQAYSAEGFDVANFVIQAIKAGARDSQAIGAYLHGNSYQGVSRTFKYQANGEPEGTTINIYQIKGDKIVWLGTTDTLIK